jgi:hypothetical protein
MQRKLWSWKTDKAGQVLNVLIPGNDHGWDATGYALEPHILGHKKHIQQRDAAPILDSRGHPIRPGGNGTLQRLSNPNLWMV